MTQKPDLLITDEIVAKAQDAYANASCLRRVSRIGMKAALQTVLPEIIERHMAEAEGVKATFHQGFSLCHSAEPPVRLVLAGEQPKEESDAE